jgi:SAM-dependent methyltransferase
MTDKPLELETKYSQSFFDEIGTYAIASAREIVPWILETLKPTSVLDVGCGDGTWLSAFKECGLDEIHGVDGDYIALENLKIPRDCFTVSNLESSFDLGRTYDLVMSLEVAEHLTEAAADNFVDSLIKHGKIIVFSAAIPSQGGTGHQNEQWPQYWADRFTSRGYVLVDCFRKRFWNNKNVKYWYSQNMFLFVSNDHLENLYTDSISNEGVEELLSFVHPHAFEGLAKQYRFSQSELLRYQSELSEYKEKLAACIERCEYYKFKANPQNMLLRDVLKVLPSVGYHGVKRTLKNIPEIGKRFRNFQG